MQKILLVVRVVGTASDMMLNEILCSEVKSSKIAVTQRSIT